MREITGTIVGIVIPLEVTLLASIIVEEPPPFNCPIWDMCKNSSSLAHFAPKWLTIFLVFA